MTASSCSLSTGRDLPSTRRTRRAQGDRVVRARPREVMAKILVRRTAKAVELASFNPAHRNLVFTVNRIDWMARIVWASQ